MHTHTHTYIYTYIQVHSCVSTTGLDIVALTYGVLMLVSSTQIDSHTHTHTYTYAHTYIHTHTYTHTYIYMYTGTYVRINHWSRHRNPDLWGPDAGEFNPDRDWKPEELWCGDVLRGYNPQSDRFSPFSFPGRDCIGKNFSRKCVCACVCICMCVYMHVCVSVCMYVCVERL